MTIFEHTQYILYGPHVYLTLLDMYIWASGDSSVLNAHTKQKENKYNEQKYKKSYTNNGIYMRNNMKSLSISVTLEIYVAEAFDKCTPVTVYDIAQLKE